MNGNEIFPAMLKAIRGAQKTITFETFIYWSGAIGQEFAEALTERARAGVHVHVVVDGKIGFTGGVGIAVPWTGNAQDPQHWRDTHFRIEGGLFSSQL